MKLKFPLSTEGQPKFESRLASPYSSCRSITQPVRSMSQARPDKSNLLLSRPQDESEIVASFGAANLIRRRDGCWELHGGSPSDHAAAREWSSLFQHEATFASLPLPAAAPPPQAGKTIHNHILIADDDILVRGSLAAVLECEGFVVDEASDGTEAISRATAHAPDLVLLDLNMPKMDGWMAFTKLDRVRPLVPVIIITARPHQYNEAVRLGVDAFMEKPLNIPILLRAIKNLTNEDENRHVRRITKRTFVTRLLGGAGD